MATSTPPTLTLTEFLESSPPNTRLVVQKAVEHKYNPKGPDWRVVRPPDIQLYCASKACGGVRIHTCVSHEEIELKENKGHALFLTYVCRHCNESEKTFAVIISYKNNVETSAEFHKLGETPPFGPHIPARVISLIGPDRDTFLKGTRAENQGLGIGAYAYYRRVIENQKGRIIEEIGRIAARLGASTEIQSVFAAAAKETQFSKAIDLIKAAIPESLKINGHNPLVLLHSALSEGLHGGTDAECLEMAKDIRVVLTELADRISQALKDEAELSQAVARLQARSRPKNVAKPEE